MEYKVGVKGTYGCAGFRGELRIHIISHMMRVIVTDGVINAIANIRHGVWMKRNGRAQLLSLFLSVDSGGLQEVSNVLFVVDALKIVMCSCKVTCQVSRSKLRSHKDSVGAG
jgi:hypothetical protein